jgi:hypothetical protein
LKVWRTGPELQSSRVDFYERLVGLLEKRGIKREPHQTPWEFAAALSIPEALYVTRVYNRVRFGGVPLTNEEVDELIIALRRLERRERVDRATA